MDNRKYEVFLSIAETNNITETAEQLGYSQSGVTQMIKSMEQELGVPLLIRTNKGTYLSGAGKELLPLMREAVRWEEQIRQKCAQLTGRHSGRLTVGCLSSISEFLMPAVLSEISSIYPDIRVIMKEHESPGLREMLTDGRIDVAICEGPQGHFDGVRLIEDEILGVTAYDHPLAEQDPVTLEELRQYPLISYATGDTGRVTSGWPEMMTKGTRWQVLHSCKDNLTAMNMVAHGLGVTIGSDLIMTESRSKCRILHLDPPQTRSIWLLHRADEPLTPAAKIFAEILQRMVSERRMPGAETFE